MAEPSETKENLNKDLDTLRNEIKNLELLNTFYSGSTPRNMFLSASVDGLITAVDRDSELAKRDTMLRDAFVRELVKVIIVRAIGSTQNSTAPFEIVIDDDVKLDEQYKKLIKNEFDYLERLINNELLDLALQSQFYGDSYVKLEFEKQKGVTKLLKNYSTNPFNILPIMTNRLTTLAYEVTLDSYKFTNTTKTSRTMMTSKNSRYYVAPLNIARLNAQGNATDTITTTQYSTLDNMNVFADDERVYEDSVSGGIVEGIYEYYTNYKFALTSLANTRIASSVVERFIVHSLEGVGDSEKRLLKTALERQLKDTLDAVAKKTTDKNPSLMVANHMIPTTNGATNSVSIQESNLAPSGFQNIEDILAHIKAFVGALGYSYQMTAFADGQTGGREREQFVDASFTMDNRSSEIRVSIQKFIFQIIKVHFLAKFDLDINTEILNINFNSVVNYNKIEAERQRVENISNNQMVLSLIEQFRGLQMKDNEENRLMLRAMMRDMISQTSDNREEQIDALVNIVLTPPPPPPEGGGF